MQQKETQLQLSVLVMDIRLAKSSENIQSPEWSKIRFIKHPQVGLACLDKQVGSGNK